LPFYSKWRGIPTKERTGKKMVFLSAGFRPFFLLAALYAVLSPVIWLLALSGDVSLPGPLSAASWHAHEMLFGFATAGLAGFLLTAVPLWTKAPPVRGGRLAALVILWMAGRIAFGLSNVLPPVIVALADLSFIPVLLYGVGAQIFDAGEQKNYVFPALLFFLFLGNWMVHLETMGVIEGIAYEGVRLAVYVYVMLVAVLSGRLIPGFTNNVLKQRGRKEITPASPFVESVIYLALGAMAVVDMAIGEENLPAGILALVAAAALLLRMKGWRTFFILDQPILWVLHLGAAWLVFGLFLLGLAGLSESVTQITGIHALSIGAIGTTLIAVMSRAALGHTGRPIKAPFLIVAAYLIIGASAIARVTASLEVFDDNDVLIEASGLLWILAFVLFSVVYGPILMASRKGA
jgi:uncharacterized protein involved in response to NO